MYQCADKVHLLNDKKSALIYKLIKFHGKDRT